MNASPITATKAQDARVRAAYAQTGEPPFFVVGYIAETHGDDLRDSLEKGELEPIADDSTGGIVAYAWGEKNANRLAGLLNAAASEQASAPVTAHPSRAPITVIELLARALVFVETARDCGSEDARELAHAIRNTLQAATVIDGETATTPPTVFVTLHRGIASVYGNRPDISAEVIDPDVDDADKHDAAEARADEIAAEVKAGTLWELA